MIYHAQLEYGGKLYPLWNFTEDDMTEHVVLPFINGQVTLLPDQEGSCLFNFKTVSALIIYETDNELTDPKKIGTISFKKHDCTVDFINKVKKSSATPAFTSLLQKAFQPALPQMFVIMKFGDEIMDSAYKAVYKPVARKYGLECVRIDEIPDSGKISDQILEKIAESKYIVADLSGARPNCYYEAGFAHALGKTLILSIRDGESAHFDLQGHRFIQWKTESDLKTKLSGRLTALESVMKGALQKKENTAK